MKTLLEQLKENGALEVTSTIQSILKQKTKEAIEEARKQVAADTFGVSFESETKVTVKEAMQTLGVSQTMLQEAMSKQHYVGLADHIKSSGVPFSHEHLKVLSGFMKKDNPKFDADRWHKYVSGQVGPSGGKLKEAQQQHHAVSKPAARTPEEIKAQKKKDWQNDVRMPWPKGTQSKSKSPIHDFAETEKLTPEQIKAKKKADWKNDVRMPWPNDKQSKSKSPIHDFAEDVKKKLVDMTEAVAYPAKSKHLKDYKPTSDSEHEMHLEHPDGHKLVWHKKDNTFTHTSKDGKTKKGKMVDLHPHLMKTHHNFDEKVKQHMRDHMHDNGMGLLHKMGKIDYAHKTHPEGRDHEEDAVNYKAMHKAAMHFQNSDRKAARAVYDAAHKGEK